MLDPRFGWEIAAFALDVGPRTTLQLAGNQQQERSRELPEVERG
jgi:hypothetical protein